MNAERQEDISAEMVPKTQTLPRSWFVMAAAGAALLVGAYVWSLRSVSTVGGLRVAGVPMGGVPYAELPARLDAAAQQFLDGKMVLALGGREWTAKRREVGLVVSSARALEAVK